ncbi:MAG: 2'-5' RNA ligase family protein [Actinomycetota bacterium]|nr:2'-5' RNA ligase family protein [Actinomycetota bacterium]
MALAVCLLFDERTNRSLRRLWDRLEELDVPTLRTHTHGRHVPHLSYAVLRDWRLDDVRERVEALPAGPAVDLHFDALGTFRRGRSWLVPAVTSDLVRRQEAVVEAVADCGELHRHYAPGAWVPHCTVAPRVPLTALPVLAAAVYDVLPLPARADRAALVDSGTGRVWPLASLP